MGLVLKVEMVKKNLYIKKMMFGEEIMGFLLRFGRFGLVFGVGYVIGFVFVSGFLGGNGVMGFVRDVWELWLNFSLGLGFDKDVCLNVDEKVIVNMFF